MAIAEHIPSATTTAESTTTRTGMWYLSLKWPILGVSLVAAFAGFARWYQGWASWDYGMDSTHPDFHTYWMNFMYIEIAVFASIFVLSLSYIWFTRDRNLSALSAEDEMKRMMFFIGMLLVYAWAFVFAGSFFAEQDAAWHQVVVRDTSFTPSHIVEFYGMFPMFICLGFSTFLWAMTRLPLYAKGFSIPLVIATTGPMMVLPNVGFNEWGHAFWFMEEYFTAPLHYGFVFFGWSILGLGGILVQVMSRFSVLIGQIWGNNPRPAG